MKFWLYLMMVIGAAAMSGCFGVKNSANLPVVTNFELPRYLGTWYEVVRLPHHFEHGLDNVTATYSMRDDGGVNVLNRGRTASGVWREARGRAYFVDNADTGLLKVTFFWPFYGEYRIVKLDPDYRWAVVTSSTTNYYWILSRTPQMAPEKIEQLVCQAALSGFVTSQFIYVKHDAVK